MLKPIVFFLAAGIALAQQSTVPGQSAGRETTDPRNAATQRLTDLRKQLDYNRGGLYFLNTQFADDHPAVVAAKQRIRDIEAQIEKQQEVVAALNQPSHALPMPLPERWWRNPAAAQSVGLTADQQKKMDDVFRQYLPKLVDLEANLDRQQLLLDPLVEFEPLDEKKITAQIDSIAEARAELEKANGRMLLGIRKLLTPDQWAKLNGSFSLVPGAKTSAK